MSLSIELQGQLDSRVDVGVVGILEEHLSNPGVGRVGVLNARFPSLPCHSLVAQVAMFAGRCEKIDGRMEFVVRSRLAGRRRRVLLCPRALELDIVRVEPVEPLGTMSQGGLGESLRQSKEKLRYSADRGEGGRSGRSTLEDNPQRCVEWR